MIPRLWRDSTPFSIFTCVCEGGADCGRWTSASADWFLLAGVVGGDLGDTGVVGREDEGSISSTTVGETAFRLRSHRSTGTGSRVKAARLSFSMARARCSALIVCSTFSTWDFSLLIASTCIGGRRPSFILTDEVARLSFAMAEARCLAIVICSISAPGLVRCRRALLRGLIRTGSSDEAVEKPDTCDVEMRYRQSAHLRNIDGRLCLSSHVNHKRPFVEEMILIEVTVDELR